LIDLHKRLGLTTIFVTHDQEEALSLSGKVVLMNGGRIEQIGAPDDVYTMPQTQFASDFLGSANLVPAEIVHRDNRTIAELAPGIGLTLGATEATGRRMLALRQEDLQLHKSGADGAGVAATVEARVFLGARIRYVLRVGEHRLKCLSPPNLLLQPGETVTVGIAPERIRILDR
jgi:ABC-type Fe3+/spermidine/putrescine transport system ATPase subunit